MANEQNKKENNNTPPPSGMERFLDRYRHSKSAFFNWFKDPAVRAFFSSPIFWIVLTLKIILGTLFASYFMRDLFIPFVNYFVESGFQNPWHYFAEQGRLRVFPYPPMMLYIMTIPRVIFAPILPKGIDTVTIRHLFVMRLPLLFGDIGIAILLVKWFRHRIKRVLIYYWCSPFVIYVCYWHGQLDIIPTAIFLACLYLLYRKYYNWSMVFMGLSLASKSHLFVAVPFILVYIYQERKFLGILRAVAIMSVVYGLIVLPYLPDPGYRRIVYGTSEQGRMFAFQLRIGYNNLAILLAPAAILILWFRFVAYAKRNWDLLMLFLGILFSVFILLSPPMPGYFLWSLPFLIHFMCREHKVNSMPYIIYASMYLVFFLFGSQSDLFGAWKVISPAIASLETPFRMLVNAIGASHAIVIRNLVFTAMDISLAGIVLNMYLFGVRSNAVYRMRTKPILIGVAGDSGAGKDTFSRSAVELFGEDRVTIMAGDDYHRWPRGHDMWQVYTHLDVKSNDLYRQQEHALALSRGESILKGTYDHDTGKFTEATLFDPNEVVIFQGLHTFSIEALRGLLDLKVFMDPDENLRKLWKVRRDCLVRGYNLEEVIRKIEERAQDRQKYILTQREYADVIVSWVPVKPIEKIDCETEEPELVMEVNALNSFNITSLLDRLRECEGITVEHDPYVDARRQFVRIKGKIPYRRIETIAFEIVPNMEEITTLPRFSDDCAGCLQLIILICLSHKLHWYSSQ